MNLSSFTKPEYFLRPRQVLKRFLNAADANCKTPVLLPSGLSIYVSPGDALGKAIRASGIYDLCLTEALWRLTKPGDLCINVGANIGYASSIMANRAGVCGEVLAFEPHPQVFEELLRNTAGWNQSGTTAQIDCIKKGISDYTGERLLNIPPDFNCNRGMAHFYNENEEPLTSNGKLMVQCIKLDEFAETTCLASIDILKVDAEGHEIQVLKSALKLLQEKRIGHIIFEDSRGSWRTPKGLYDDYRFLIGLGYSVFRLKRGIFAPKFEMMEDIKNDDSTTWKSWEPPNFIATADSSATQAILARYGWYSLLNLDF